jgi:kynureninase
MREYFHVPENYFLNHSVGCLPKSVDGLEIDFLTPWREGSNWQNWMGIIDSYRDNMAGLLGVRAKSICPEINISSALTKIIHSVPFNSNRNIIVLSEQDFPTIGFVARQAEKFGYRLRFVKGDPTQAENWDAAIQLDTAFVLVTHALSNTSHLLPVEDICASAAQAGAMSIVDIAQSLGAVPVPLAKWKCDFAMGTGVKFLCAGPGACFLYVAEHILPKCQPIDVGWFSHENPFEMDIHNFQYAEDAMRFFGGTPSPAPYAMANGALDLWGRIGIDKAHNIIQKHLTRLTEHLPDKVLVSPRDAKARGATLVVNPKNRRGLKEALEAQAIFFDERKEGFRFSVHGYTGDEEISRLSHILLEFD